MNGAGSAPFHLLEIVDAAHIAHEEQHFERLHVGSGGDHIDRDGDARIVGITKTTQNGLGIFLGFIGHLFTKLVPFIKLLANDFDDVVGMAIGFGKHECFRHFIVAVFIHAVGVDFCF